MTNKFHTVRRLNRPIQYIMYLINLSSYFYETYFFKMSSIDQLLMASQDITDAFKHPHTYGIFATILDNTTTALTKLVATFTKKLNKPQVQETTMESKAA